MRIINGYFPLWKPTFDGRRITSLGLLRAFPLPLLAAPRVGNADHIGRIEGVTVTVDRFGTLVTCVCSLNDSVDRAQYDGWFLGPDLDSVTSVFAGNQTTMTGNLIGATLTSVPAWITSERSSSDDRRDRPPCSAGRVHARLPCPQTC